MPYVLRNPSGAIEAVSMSEMAGADWQSIEGSSREYMDYLEASIAEQDKFRESDIHLARVLEDLINLLTEREVIRFTDFPVAAQKRLLNRQSLRKEVRGLNLFDDGPDYII